MERIKLVKVKRSKMQDMAAPLMKPMEGLTVPIKAVGEEPTQVTLEGETALFPAVGTMVEKLQTIAEENGWQISKMSIKWIGEK